MAQNFLASPQFQVLDSNGNPVSGAKAYFYDEGTTTPRDVYQENSLTTPHTNPVIADATGTFDEIYLTPTVNYKCVIKDSSDVTIRTIEVVNTGNAWDDSVNKDIVPDGDNTRDLGSLSNRFAELHVKKVLFDADTSITQAAEDEVRVEVGGTNTATGDSEGRIIIGHTESITGTGSLEYGIQNHQTTFAMASLGQFRWANASSGCSNLGALSRGASIGTHASVADGDNLVQFAGVGSDGSAFQISGAYRIYVEGTPTSGVVNGQSRVYLATSGTMTERFRIANSGSITSQATYDNTVSGSAVHVTSAGVIGRTSSSEKYKKDIEDVEDKKALDILSKVKPKFFRRKKANGDLKPEWSQYGFIAEQVDGVDSRLAKCALYEMQESVEIVDGVKQASFKPVKRETPMVEDIDRDALLAALWKSVQLLQAEIETLKAR